MVMVYSVKQLSWQKPVKPVHDECNTVSYMHSFWPLLVALEKAKSYDKYLFYYIQLWHMTGGRESSV